MLWQNIERHEPGEDSAKSGTAQFPFFRISLLEEYSTKLTYLGKPPYKITGVYSGIVQTAIWSPLSRTFGHLAALLFLLFLGCLKAP